MSVILFSLPASFHTYQNLGNFMYEHGLTQEMFEIVDTAVNAWMSDFLKKEEQGLAFRLEGYQWKDVFLPSGTTLRTVYKRTSYLAHIKSCAVIYEGRSLSPGEFVNEVAKCNRNAWRTLWVRFPNEDEWKPAMSLRKRAAVLETKRDRLRPKKTV
jgi:hypothetical protein